MSATKQRLESIASNAVRIARCTSKRHYRLTPEQATQEAVLEDPEARKNAQAWIKQILPYVVAGIDDDMRNGGR